MPRINLLPWREALREQRRKQFLQGLLFALLAGLGLVLGAGVWIDGDIATQEARNERLQEANAELDRQISEIRNLERERRDLLARMQVIQELQGNRPVIVRIFDELVRTLADGVFFTSLQLSGERLAVEGVAESNDRISELMRNLDRSDWFGNPNLQGLREMPEYGPQASRFNLTVSRTLPRDQKGD